MAFFSLIAFWPKKKSHAFKVRVSKQNVESSIMVMTNLVPRVFHLPRSLWGGQMKDPGNEVGILGSNRIDFVFVGGVLFAPTQIMTITTKKNCLIQTIQQLQSCINPQYINLPMNREEIGHQ